MKLKKVVSLALAGVMAVSMLAACGTEPTKDPTEGETETTATDYSAEFSKYLDESYGKLDYVTYKSNAADQAALQKAVDSMTETEIIGLLGKGKTDETVSGTAAVSIFTDEAELDAYRFDTGFQNDKTNMNVPMKIGFIRMADGSASVEQAVKYAAEVLNNKLNQTTTAAKLLPETLSDSSTTYDFTYTVSVSVVTREMRTIGGISLGSVNFVAVTVTRTGAPAKV